MRASGRCSLRSGGDSDFLDAANGLPSPLLIETSSQEENNYRSRSAENENEMDELN